MHQYHEIKVALYERDRCCCKDCDEWTDCDELYNAKRLIMAIEEHLHIHNCIESPCEKLVELDGKLVLLLNKLEDCAWQQKDSISRY